MKTCLALVLAATLVVGATADAGRPAQRRIIPSDAWVDIYFDAIDAASSRMGLKPLRDTRLANDDVELRLWRGFGLSPLTGFVVKRSSGKWSARAAQLAADGAGRPRPLTVPDSTQWAEVWQELHRRGIAEIRDDSERPTCHRIFDGLGYVVELASADSYRIYHVRNPEVERSEDGDRFHRLLPVLLEAFGEKSGTDVDRLPTGERRPVTTVIVDVPATLVETEWVSSSQADEIKGAEVVLTSQEAVSQSSDLKIPTCEELPLELKALRFDAPHGDVAVELLIAPDGAVRAARARSGHPILHKLSTETALRWSFKPLPGDTRVRRTLLTIRYHEDWVEFPWLKRK